jgi:UDP-2,3-diacylglucosamine pyrophosphatase LpxH
VDGVLCGHIHKAAIRKLDGIDYYNCGDFVESCTALVEHFDGRIELLSGFHLAEDTEEAEPEEVFELALN